MLGYLGLTEEQRNDAALYNQGVYHNQTAYSAQSGYYSQPISSNEKKRADALIYLQGRGKYLLDNKFTPTTSVCVDVAKTIREYLEEVK